MKKLVHSLRALAEKARSPAGIREMERKKEAREKRAEKRRMILLGTVHTLLGILYND